MEAIRAQLGVEKLTLFGISYGTELAIEYARAYPQHVERLILDSVVDPDDTDPYFTSTLPRHGPVAALAVPGPAAAGSAPNPGDDLGQLVAQLRAKPMVARAYDDRGRPHKVTITPLDADGPDARHRLHPAAARDRADRGALRAGRRRGAAGAHDPRLERARRARLAARLLDRPLRDRLRDEPMPWDPGTPIDQRPAVVQQRIAALPPDTFAPFDPPVVVGDEIDLCLRWPDVPRPPSTAAPLPYPTVPTLILQGGEDLRTPPEVSARVAARIPGSVAARRARHRALDRQRPAHLLARRDRCASSRASRCRSRRASGSRPASRRSSARPQSLRVAARARAACRARSGGPSARSAPRSTTSGSCVSPAALATSGGGLRGGSWAIRGDRLVLKRYEAVSGVTVTGSGGAEAHAARRGLQGRARNGHAALRRAAVRDARRPSRSRSTRARRTSRPPRRPWHLSWRADIPRFRSYCRHVRRRLRSRPGVEAH